MSTVILLFCLKNIASEAIWGARYRRIALVGVPDDMPNSSGQVKSMASALLINDVLRRVIC